MNTQEYRFIEVFKTNATNQTAVALQALISQNFPRYQINFDLEDCDRVLRVVSLGSPVQILAVIGLAQELGMVVCPLEDAGFAMPPGSSVPASRESTAG